MSSIVLYGGAFDPIHRGHLRIASYAADALGADVFLIPNKTPPWKVEKASVKDRVAMLRLALEENKHPYLHLSTFEVDSMSPISYSIETVRYFKELYPNEKIYLLVGMDAANEFEKWKEPDEIAALCSIIVIPRDGIAIKEENRLRFHMEVLGYLDSGPVSSSSVRAFLSYDIFDSTRDYIETHQLYYMKQVASYYDARRLVHALSVARLAYQIATSNHIPSPGRAYCAGLLHDIAKNIDEGKAKEMMKGEFEEFRSFPSWTYHQFLGAKIAKDDFHIDDKEILSAISCHATGKGKMGVLDKILYAADKIEPTRGYDSGGYISSCLEDIEQGFRIVVAANIEYYRQKGYPFGDNPYSKACMETYAGVEHD